jgi:hypothetical protein
MDNGHFEPFSRQRDNIPIELDRWDREPRSVDADVNDSGVHKQVLSLAG